MEYLFKWLEANQLYSDILIGTIILFLFILALVILIAMVQGRKITFWPPSIGEKPNLVHIENNSNCNSNNIKKYDLFISAPMTSIDAEEYLNLREDVLMLEKHFRDQLNMNEIHYIGKKITKADKADPPAISIEDDLKNLAASKRYVLIYPKPILTSCLVEAGYALGLGIPSTYFVKDRDHLPYMLREAAVTNKNVKTYCYKNAEHLAELVDTYKYRLIPGLDEV